MEDMEEYMRCLDTIALTNHIDEEEFEFEEKPIRVEVKAVENPDRPEEDD